MKENTGTCKEFDKCLKILYLMLDNEASSEEETYLQNHIDRCMVCFEQYKVEREIRSLIKTKIKRQPVPADLAQNIRKKIFIKA